MSVLILDGSFSGTQFMQRFDQGWSPEDYETAADTTILRPPGSDTVIVQTSGKVARTLTLPVYCTAAALSALRSSVSSSGSLSYWGGTTTARLLAVRGVRRVSKPHQDYHQAQLDFLLTG